MKGTGEAAASPTTFQNAEPETEKNFDVGFGRQVIHSPSSVCWNPANWFATFQQTRMLDSSKPVC